MYSKVILAQRYHTSLAERNLTFFDTIDKFICINKRGSKNQVQYDIIVKYYQWFTLWPYCPLKL